VETLSNDQISNNKHTSLTTCTTHRRVLLQSFVVAIIGALPNPASAKGKKKPCNSLEDARAQLDLAVQASSVQAFQDAKELVNDSSLSDSNLNKAFDLCPNSNTPSSREIATAAVQNFRMKLNQSTPLQTEDTMAAMQFGTNARTAVDAQLLQTE